jgi:AcrR family transcriptional regulator
MSPQPSNRQRLVEGTMRCLERLSPERVTAREIAAESGANLASIGYHFGSKDELVTEAVIEGLDRWLTEISAAMGDMTSEPRVARLRRAWEAIDRTRERHLGLARNFVGALAAAQRESRLRELFVDGFVRTRPAVAALLELGDDRAGEDAAGLLHSMFVGLLFQALLDPSLGIEGERMQRAQARLRDALPVSES